MARRQLSRLSPEVSEAVVGVVAAFTGDYLRILQPYGQWYLLAFNVAMLVVVFSSSDRRSS